MVVPFWRLEISSISALIWLYDFIRTLEDSNVTVIRFTLLFSDNCDILDGG
jgi:hypothetical protein